MDPALKFLAQVLMMSTVFRARPGGPPFTTDGKRARISIGNGSREEAIPRNIYVQVVGEREHRLDHNNMLGDASYQVSHGAVEMVNQHKRLGRQTIRDSL